MVVLTKALDGSFFAVRILLLIIFILLLNSCWITHTVKDKPELMQQVGKSMLLTQPAFLFNDKGGRSHFTQDPERYYLPITENAVTLPQNTRVEILKAIYRILPAGRSDFFVVVVTHENKKWQFEIHATGKYKPQWNELTEEPIGRGHARPTQQ